MTTNELTVREGLPPSVAPPKITPETIQETKQSIALLQGMVKDILIRGVDYGRIPGTPQDSLWDPGASQILSSFNCYPGQRRILKLEDNEQKIVVCVEVPIISRATQREVGSGVGAASTLETKYKYRWVANPKEWGYDDEALKTFRTKKGKDDEGNNTTVYRIPNPEHSELLNTIVKMACLGSTVPVLFKTSKCTVRGNVSQMFDCFKKTGTAYLPTPKGIWSRVTAMQRQDAKLCLRLKLRDGSVIRATTEHRFPTEAGIKRVDEIKAGDILLRSPIPAGEGQANPDYGWLVGFFLAEGQYEYKQQSIRFTTNANEEAAAERISSLLTPWGCRVRRHVRPNSENTADINVYGDAAAGLMLQFIDGSTSYKKHLSRYAWEQSREFLKGVLDGYLEGDSYRLERPGRTLEWPLGFTGKNLELAEDLRTLASILDMRISLKKRYQTLGDKRYLCFDGWIKPRVPTYNLKNLTEVISIEKETKTAVVYDISIEARDDIFLLSNGIHTHNSKRAEVDAAETLPGVASVLRAMFSGQPFRKTEAEEQYTGPRWQRFWGEVRRLGYTDQEAHAKLKVKSMKEWLAQGLSLDEALDILRGKGTNQAASAPGESETAEATPSDRGYDKQMIQSAAGKLKWDYKRLAKELKERTGFASIDDIPDDKLHEVASKLTDMAEAA